MKKSVIVALLLGILLFFPLVLAQEQTQAYSGFNRFTDSVRLFFSGGDNKVGVALEIREKEIDSAIINSQNKDEKEAIKNLERAHEKLKLVREKISLDVADEIEENVGEIVNKIEDEENLSDNFDVYVLEEKKTQLTAVLTKETFEYCKKLAEEDFYLMLQEEKCDPDSAPDSLKEELKALKKLQEKLFTELMWNIRSCIDDPGTCNCDEVADINDKGKCEKMVALAIKCEYKEDETSCDELKVMEPKQGDGFAESFVPDFLMNLFREKQSMVDYDIEKSDGVPPECWNWNEKPECRQYDYLKEWHYRGENNEERPGKPKDKEPTMEESVPECFDEGVFLEEKCGEIIIVKNEKGLINYIVKNNIDGIINDFENKSGDNTIDVNGSLGQAVWDVEEGIRQVEEDIQNWVVDHPPMDVEGGEGLTWDIKTDVAGTSSGGGGGNGDVDNVIAGDSGGSGGTTTAGGNDVAGVDEGPGEPGVVDED